MTKNNSFYAWWGIVSAVLIIAGVLLSFCINNVDKDLRLTLYYMLTVALIVLFSVLTLFLISYTKQQDSMDLYKLKRDSLIQTAIYLQTSESIYQLTFEEKFRIDPPSDGSASFSFSDKSSIELSELHEYLEQELSENQKIKIDNNESDFKKAKIIYKRNVTP